MSPEAARNPHEYASDIDFPSLDDGTLEILLDAGGLYMTKAAAELKRRRS